MEKFEESQILPKVKKCKKEKKQKKSVKELFSAFDTKLVLDKGPKL